MGRAGFAGLDRRCLVAAEVTFLMGHRTRETPTLRAVEEKPPSLNASGHERVVGSIKSDRKGQDTPRAKTRPFPGSASVEPLNLCRFSPTIVPCTRIRPGRQRPPLRTNRGGPRHSSLLSRAERAV